MDDAAGRGPWWPVVRTVACDRAGRTVLSESTWSCGPATLTVIQGRSGSGKTTLLRVLCGLERPDRGSVEVGGIDLAGPLDRAGLAALRRRQVAVAGQSTALLETMDTEENIELVRLARGLPSDPDRVERGWPRWA